MLIVLVILGGYNFPNTARLWTSITALATGTILDENIPEHKFWPQYGPDYVLHIEPTLAKDSNKKSYLDDCISSITGTVIKMMKFYFLNRYNTVDSSCSNQPILYYM